MVYLALTYNQCPEVIIDLINHGLFSYGYYNAPTLPRLGYMAGSANIAEKGAWFFDVQQ